MVKIDTYPSLYRWFFKKSLGVLFEIKVINFETFKKFKTVMEKESGYLIKAIRSIEEEDSLLKNFKAL